MGHATQIIRLTRLSAVTRDDFDRTHAGNEGPGWCQCVAWWVPTWQGWGERSAAENHSIRDRLFRDNIADGYLIYVADTLAGWVQADRRDRFEKIRNQFALAPDDGAYMIGCFVILPGFRRQGVARAALDRVIDALKLRGATAIEAFPRRGARDEGEMWNGPEAIYKVHGFRVVQDDPTRPVLRLDL